MYIILVVSKVLVVAIPKDNVSILGFTPKVPLEVVPLSTIVKIIVQTFVLQQSVVTVFVQPEKIPEIVHKIVCTLAVAVLVSQMPPALGVFQIAIIIVVFRNTVALVVRPTVEVILLLQVLDSVTQAM